MPVTCPDKPLRVVLALSGLIAWAQPALAAPEEVQVYMDEINPAGGVGLDIHANYVPSGDRATDYPGEQPSLHRWRITPEFSLGLGGGFEAGLYLPLTTIAPGEPWQAGGVKARIKWLAPHGDEGFYWGANLEIGRVSHRLDSNPWNGELKLIGGWRQGRWRVGMNGNFDFVVDGPGHDPVTAELASKIDYQVTNAIRLGVESYNGLGPMRDPGHLSDQEHATYLTMDAKLGRWDMNAGIGRGYGANADRTIVKFIIGVPIGREK